jgi:hypothetical protein
MQISGECTLAQVSFEQFKQLLPEAFERRHINETGGWRKAWRALSAKNLWVGSSD